MVSLSRIRSRQRPTNLYRRAAHILSRCALALVIVATGIGGFRNGDTSQVRVGNVHLGVSVWGVDIEAGTWGVAVLDAPQNRGSMLVSGWRNLPGEAVAGGTLGLGLGVGQGVSSFGVGRDHQSQDWLPLVSLYEWSAQVLHAIIQCESTARPLAVSPDGQNWGLLQLNLVHLDKLEALTGSRDPQLLLDPAVNIAVAWLVYVEADYSFSPWVCWL